MEEYDAEECKCGNDRCEKGDTIIKMNKHDVALVLRETETEGDFAIEIVYPDVDSDSIVSGAVEFVTAIASRMSDQEFVDEQSEWLRERLDSLDEMLGEEIEVDLEEKPEE